MILYKKILIIFFLLILSISGMGQESLQDLRKKQDELNQTIEETSKALSLTQKKRVRTINQLYLLNRQIRKRKQLIGEYNAEINIINRSIEINEQKMDSIQKRIRQLKNEYAKIIRQYYSVYKERGNILAYIVSSKSVNQAYKRLKYFQQYIGYIHKIFNELTKAEELLKQENRKLEDNKRTKVQALNRLKKEEQKYRTEKLLKNNYVISLRKKERQLRKELRNKEKVRKKLADTMRKMMEEERKRNKGMMLTPEEKLIAGKFDANKGKLPWPAAKGIIIETYGSHRHPVLRNVTVKNDGIDIMTEKNAYARSVFDGEVRKIVAIPGANETVIIKHGNYYTVYQNVYKVSVKVGQKVKAKDKIGIVFTDPANQETVLHFEIWRGTQKMNPEIWLAKSK